MTPPPCELFRALLRRALGGRSMGNALLLAAVAGGVAGWLGARHQAAGMGALPSRGLLAWLLVNYQHTAMYGLGFFTALQLAAAYGADARVGWTVQYLAAGGTRDRYLLALAAAAAGSAGLLYLLTVSAWVTVATAFGRQVALLPGTALLIPVALLWLATPAAFAAAAVALAGGTGRAVALMIGVVLLPWLILAALAPSPEASAPVWLAWATLPAPPYPIAASAGIAGFLMAHASIMLGVAYLAAPRRLLRA